MKLLKEFTKQIGKFEKLKKVWLTSFNINIEFIEKYVLPAILGIDVPKNRMDYEALQLELNNSGIDFRVFCDKRFMGLEGNKRTAIPIYGISPGAGGRFENRGFTKNNIFHAKVVYLEGGRGESSILGTGSANLTLDGWARNQEVFHFHEITSMPVQKSVKQFFDAVFENLDYEQGYNPMVSRQNLERDSKISFCHSFQYTSFLEQLYGDKGIGELSVWSPYFPEDLAAFIERLKEYFEEPDLIINIVPDRVEGQYLRTEWSDSIDKKIKAKEIRFYNNPSSSDDRSSLCHAKVWKTKSYLAIGSWNFTNAGSNILLSKGSEFQSTSNIEAGFIIENRSAVENILGKPFSAIASAFASLEQMQEEALEVPDNLPFDLFVSFHWSDLTYRFYGTWNDGSVKDKAYKVKLPGLSAPVELIWKPRSRTLDVASIQVDRADRLLADHKYEVWKGSEVLGYGLIIEEDTKCRRPQQYEDLRGLFDAMISGGDDDSGAPVCIDEDESGRVWVNGMPLHGYDPEHIVSDHEEDISFFRLFSATYQFATKLQQIEDMKTLEHWVFLRPGCLEELVNKTVDRIGNARATAVFNWFLAKEVSELIELATKVRGWFYKSNDDIPLSRWNALTISIPKMPKEANAKYKKVIEEEYRRMHKTWGKHEES